MPKCARWQLSSGPDGDSWASIRVANSGGYIGKVTDRYGSIVSIVRGTSLRETKAKVLRKLTAAPYTGRWLCVPERGR